jgi:hypothetical protein
MLYLQLEQKHLQTPPATMQRLGLEDGDVAYTSREFSYLQAPTRTKPYNLVDEHMLAA